MIFAFCVLVFPTRCLGGHGNPHGQEPGGLPSKGLERAGHDRSNLACMHAPDVIRIVFYNLKNNFATWNFVLYLMSEW